MLETVEVSAGRRDPQGQTDGSVIWLHGLGADGHDFEPIVPELRLPDRLAVRFVFPHAPQRPVTLNNGFVMRAWFDLLSLERTAPQDEQGIRASAAQVIELIRREQARGVAAARIVLAGFSQGGAIALHAGLRYPEALAGIVALSCYLPLGGTLAEEADPANRGTPVFMAHGRVDPMLPLQLGEQARDLLLAKGQPVTWKTYPIAHAVSPEEIADIGAFLSYTLDDTSRRT